MYSVMESNCSCRSRYSRMAWEPARSESMPLVMRRMIILTVALAARVLFAGASLRRGPLGARGSFPFIGHQLMPGISRVHAVPDPMFRRGNFAGRLEDGLKTRQRRIVLRGQLGDHVLP